MGNLEKQRAEELIEQFKRKMDFNTDSKKIEKLYGQYVNKIKKLFMGQQEIASYINQLNQIKCASSNNNMYQHNMEEQSSMAYMPTRQQNEQYKVSNRNKKFFKKVVYGAIGVTVAGALGVTAYFNKKENSNEEVKSKITSFINDDPTIVNVKEEPVELPKKELAENLSFDINDNSSFIEQSATFIAHTRACGVDFASEEWVSRFSDFMYVAGLEEVDPMAYARLQNYAKTTSSIVDNYQLCADVLADDLFSVLPDTLIDYNIVADKDSYDIIMELQKLVARYNMYAIAKDSKETKVIKEDIISFFMDHFINQDSRIYTKFTTEFIGRMAFRIDIILPGGLPEEITKKLNEDLYNCGIIVPEGEKSKSERAQSETTIRSILDDKLMYAMMLRDQDVTSLSLVELMTEEEREEEILKRVMELNVEFVPNPEWDKDQRRYEVPLKSTPSVTLPNGKSVSNESLISLGLDPKTTTQEQYEQTVQNKFEEDAKNDSSHTIKDTNGNTVVSGSDADSQEYEQGYKAGYADGNGKCAYNESGSASYKAGYRSGYASGLADREALDKKVEEQNTTDYVDIPDVIVNETEKEIVEDFKEQQPNSSNENTVVETPSTEIQDTPVESQPDSSQEDTNLEIETEFIPVESEEIIEETEVYTEDDFVSSTHSQLEQLKMMRELLVMNQFYFSTNEYQMSDTNIIVKSRV